MGNIEDGQDGNVNVSVLVLAIEDRDDYRIVHRMRWTRRGKILDSLLELPLKSLGLRKYLVELIGTAIGQGTM